MTILEEFVFEALRDKLAELFLEYAPGGDVSSFETGIFTAYRASPYVGRRVPSLRAGHYLFRWRLFPSLVSRGVNQWIERSGLSAEDAAFLLFEWNMLRANHSLATTGVTLTADYPLPEIHVSDPTFLDDAWEDLLLSFKYVVFSYPSGQPQEYHKCFWLGVYCLRVMYLGYCARELQRVKFGLY